MNMRAQQHDQESSIVSRTGSPWLWIGLLAGTLLRLIAWRFQPFVTYDGTAYASLGKALWNGRIEPSVYSPGYPALIGLLRFVVFDPVLAAAIVSFVSGIALLVVVWHLSLRTVGIRWAPLALLLVAVHPELARFSTLSMSESAFLAFAYGAYVFADRGFRSGALLGAAYAVRPEGLLLACALFLERCVRVARSTLPASFVPRFALGVAALALPCILYFHAAHGVWTLTPKIEAIRPPTMDWRSDEPRLSDLATESLAQRLDPVRRIVRHGPELLRAWPHNAARTGAEVLLLWPVPLLLLSVWGLVLRRSPESSVLLYALALPWFGLSDQPRFALVFIPALAVAAAVPFARSSTRSLRALALVLLISGVGLCATNHRSSFTEPFDGDLEPARRAGRWLSGVLPPGSVIMSRKPFVAFYAGGTARMLPDDSYDTVISNAVQSGVAAIVLEEQLVRSMRPQFAPLVFDPGFYAHEPRLELIYVGGDQPDYGLVVLRVLRPGESRRRLPPTVDIVRREGSRTFSPSAR